MFNTKDSERNIVLNGPSTSHSQPLRSKCSKHNTIDGTNAFQNSSKMPVSKSSHQKPIHVPSKVFYNSMSVSSLAEKCNDVNINSTDEDSDPISNTNSPKKKNVKKKEKLRLQIPSSEDISPSIQSAPALSTSRSFVRESQVHEFLKKHVTPLYASKSVKYLEDLANSNNEKRDTQKINIEDTFKYPYYSTSLPNTPLVQQTHLTNLQQTHHANLPQTHHANLQPIHHANLQQTRHANLQPTHHVNLQQKQHANLLQSQHTSLQQALHANLQQIQHGKLQQVHHANLQHTHHANLQHTHHASRQAYQQVPPSLVQNQNISPKYLQNMMQHPLLCNNFGKYHNFNQNHIFQASIPIPVTHINTNNSIKNPNSNNNSPNTLNKGNNSPKQKIKPKQKEKNDIFDKYMSAEEVEVGLKNNTLLEGVIRINPKQFQHSYVSSMDKSEQDVLIDGIKNRNRALEGDVVVVQYIDCENEENGEENKQRKGKVVYIKEKAHNRTCIGILQLMPDKNRQKALFLPRDHRIPRLNIPFTCWPDNFYQDSKKYENTLFLAKITEWFDTRFAMGHIVCNIGQSGDMQSETVAILAQTDLDTKPFGPEVRDLFPGLDYTIPDEEFALREDCRKLCLFSIDPFNCRDIDDAVSCRKLENGNYEIGVHIADVAHFLTENTILDEKVAEKATTIYMVEKAYHMLPDELCMLCSLFPGTDKLAFSVFWEITEDAQVLNHRFAKTVINSCCQLAYEHAQAVLENKEDAEKSFPELYNGFNYQDVRNVIQTLGKISAIFRRNRFDGGALRIDQPKVSFHLDPTNGLPDNFWIYDSKESHQLIEEFMLLANMTVATRIHEDHPKLAFLRCHPQPSIYMLRQLASSLKPMGINIDISSAGDLHRSLLPYQTDHPGKAIVLNMLCAKPMTRAKYFCAGGAENDDDFHHYALNVPLYTHFTSPIRRYADIMVHRLLAASLNYRDVPKWEVDKVRLVAANCNKQKYNAKKAGELSTELYTLKYIEMHSPLVTEAAVVEVREKYIDVIIVAMGLNRRIFFNNDFPGEYRCIKNNAGTKLSKMELKWHATDKLPAVKQTIEVFSILQVEMHKGDAEYMVKVETKLARPQA